MDIEAFLSDIRSTAPEELANRYLSAADVVAFSARTVYEGFREHIRNVITGVERVSLVGTGNWGFSLNPHKGFKPFGSSSDIDVAVISQEQFNLTWEELRKFHRSRWYQLSFEERNDLRRNGENIYAGFVSPMWIPDRKSRFRFNHERMLNGLSNEIVGYRPVRLFFFKNDEEAVDYYKRGFITARMKVTRNEI